MDCRAGQDLAFVDNKTHTDTYTEMYSIANTVSEDGNYKRVLGVDGTYLKTTTSLLNFKYWIEKTIALNPGIKFINASKGAQIKGAPAMSLKQLGTMSYKINIGGKPTWAV